MHIVPVRISSLHMESAQEAAAAAAGTYDRTASHPTLRSLASASASALALSERLWSARLRLSLTTSLRAWLYSNLTISPRNT